MKLKKQIKIWKYLAWSLPITALTTICVLYYFDLSNTLSRVLSLVLIGSISITAIWWWWVMDNLYRVTRTLMETDRKFSTVQEIVKSIKKDLS